jgi:hypothetical protein
LGPLSDKRGFDALFLAWHLDDPETLSTDLETKGVEMKKEVDAKEAVLLLAHGMDPGRRREFWAAILKREKLVRGPCWGQKS